MTIGKEAIARIVSNNMDNLEDLLNEKLNKLLIDEFPELVIDVEKRQECLMIAREIFFRGQ